MPESVLRAAPRFSQLLDIVQSLLFYAEMEVPPTATTYLKSHHISKGETIAESLKDRFECGNNPEKTEGCELISSYQCDHMTANAEFLLSKAQYKAVTGREQKRDANVLCYQIRQAFKPGEITPEEANRIGYETAMHWTKGKYAFFVATHTDR